MLRLEDLDSTRCRPEHVALVFSDLEWLGLDWDGPAVYQSRRLEALRDAAERLQRSGAAYACVCTRADLKHAQSAPQRGVEELRYPGTCRGRLADLARAATGNASGVALRFRVPDGVLSFVDGIAGPRAYDVAADVGDFVILNRARVPAYQLAVVVDDAHQGVNEVFRGDDLLASTPRQILLQRALGLAEPAWFHAPLVLDPEGRRLSKREDDLSLEALRNAAVDPRAIVSWVGSSAGFVVPPRLTARELCQFFDVSALRRQQVILSDQTLTALMSAR
jgi:glutamyl-tRNA synthetase